MKLVATYNLGSTWYAEHTVPFMRRYAQEIGADFKEFCCFPNNAEFGRSESWFHVEAFRYLAGQSRYEAMLLLDADVLIAPGSPDVFSLAEGRVGVVQDMGMPWVDEAFSQWCERHYCSRPEAGPYFNAGMMVLPRAAAQRVSPRLEGPFVDEWPHDQHYLNWLLPRHESLSWLPNRFNWMAPQFREASLQQHMIHFAGPHKPLIRDYAELLEGSLMRAGVSSPGATPLRHLARKFRTDKGSDHTYLEVYEQLLEPFRRRSISLLELGVAQGESLRLWREYFPQGRIAGADLETPAGGIDGCELYQFDQTNRHAINASFAEESIDVIIDDASHRIEDQLLSLCWLWPKLKTGGLYFVEDVADASLLRHFAPFRPLTLDRSHVRPRSDDILVVLAK